MSVRMEVRPWFLLLAASMALGACRQREVARSRLSRPCDVRNPASATDTLCIDDSTAPTIAPAPRWPACDARIGRIEIKGADSLTHLERCRIVTAAVRALAAQPDSLGPPFRADTSVVVGATIGLSQFRTVAGQLAPAYWTVDLALRSRSYGASVQLTEQGAATSTTVTGKD